MVMREAALDLLGADHIAIEVGRGGDVLDNEA